MKNKRTLWRFASIILLIGFVSIACEDPVVEPPQLTGTVSITGTAEVGQTLTANTDSLGGNGTISYYWYRNYGSEIPDENSSTYTLQSDDEGKTISVSVTRTGYSGFVTSAPTAAVKPPALTGTVSISGTVAVGRTLTVNTDSLGGSGTIFYQWNRDGTAILYETRSTYTVRSSDLNSAITVTVTRLGSSGSVTSDPAGAILPALTGTVSITGIAQGGQTLTANTGSLGGSGTISYQWNRVSANGGETTNIGTNDAYYVIRAADADSTITVTVTRSGNSDSVTSDPTATITILPLTGTVSIIGTVAVGRGLLVNTDSLGGSGAISYQWNRVETGGSTTAILGANNFSYTVQSADVGYAITITVTRSDYSGSVTSNPTTTVLSVLSGTVSISGTAHVGQTLTAITGSLGGNGTISYQWNRVSASGGDTAISGATGNTYTVQSADIGYTITVTVTRSESAGSLTSSPTATVTLPPLTGTVSISGTARVGQTLTAITSSLGGSGVISYQWNRVLAEGSPTAIPGATNYTYILGDADGGYTITVTVTRTGYSGSVTSAPTAVVPISVTGITLDKTTTIIEMGGTATLWATVTPENAANKTVSWSSNNPGVATVSSTGVVNTVAAGTAIITATAQDGGRTATCEVTVITAITLIENQWENGSVDTANSVVWYKVTSSSTFRIWWNDRGQGDGSKTGNVQVRVRNSSNSNTWIDNGWDSAQLIYGTGTVYLEVRPYGENSSNVGTYGIVWSTGSTRPPIPVTGVTLNKSTLTLNATRSETLVPTIAPSNATNKNVTWSTSNATVATVYNGEVTAHIAGTVTITATTQDGGKTATCVVTVLSGIDSVTLDKSTLTLTSGASETLTSTTTTTNSNPATIRDVTWSTSNAAVAGVNVVDNRTVTVTPYASGTATITVTTVDGGKTATCVVTVAFAPLEILMVPIPAGTFMMGSPESEPNRSLNETQHQVTLTQGFSMGKFPVTQAQYEAVMGSNPSVFNPDDNSLVHELITADFPVERVSWYDALKFCNRLSMREGLSPAYMVNGSIYPDDWGKTFNENAITIVAGSTGYRLPTEAQWEYACRAGTTTAYSWGDTGIFGWYSSNSSNRTHKVGDIWVNAWGLHDMHGNVWEWCWDQYGGGPSRVLRGGAYNTDGHYLRSAFRHYYDPLAVWTDWENGGWTRVLEFGFRVVRP
jgi:formylglycine-generating enzyme required for sulfatase activity